MHQGGAPQRERQPDKARSHIDPKVAQQLPSGWAAELRDTVKPGSLDRAAALVASALEAYAADEYLKAATILEQVKQISSRSGRVRETLGLAYYHADHWQEAARELLAARRMTGSSAQNHVIADAYRALGRPERSLEICDEVRRDAVDPEVWAEVTIVAASALADQGKLEQALARLTRAELEPKAVEPHHLRLWYVRADLLERMGRRADAKRGWDRIMAEDPAFFDVAERARS